MSGIVLALGSATNHVHLIKNELKPYFGDVTVLQFTKFEKLNISRVQKECRRNGASVVAYVLPTDGEMADDDSCQTTRDCWKHLASALYPSSYVKELEMVCYACGNGQFWLDGVDQFQATSREPVFAF